MGSKNDKHPGLEPMFGTSIWPPSATEIRATDAKLAELASRFGAGYVRTPKDGDLYVDHVADAFMYVTHEADGTMNKRRISAHEMENQAYRQQFPAWTPYDKIKMRLGLEPAEQFGFHCNIQMGPNVAFVFVASGDKGLLFEDDKNLFPSDSLIGRLQLFRSNL